MMTKEQLENLCDRLSKESDFYKSIIYDIKKSIEPVAETYRSGMAEDTDFNLGIQHALSVVSDIINSRVSETSYLHCPSLRNIVEEEKRRGAFTVIEGGLSKRNTEN